MDNAKLENEIVQAGKQIYSTIEGSVPTLFNKKWWKARVLEWAMKDEEFKIQLFRFVDTLPSLKDDKTTLRLLKEYFAVEGRTLPDVFGWGMSGLTSSTILSKLTSGVVRKNIESLAQSFIAANSTKEIVPVISNFRKSGQAFSIDLLGEQVLSNKESDYYCIHYLDLLDAVHEKIKDWEDNPLLDHDSIEPVLKADISLKISAFCPTFDPIDYRGSMQGVKKRLLSVLKKAHEVLASVTVDMEHYHFKTLTIETFKSILEEDTLNEFAHTGIAIQTYLKDSEDDVLDLVGWAKKKRKRIAIRLVKGAYWDYETVIHRQKGWDPPVFLTKEETDAQYEKLTKILLKNCAYIRPAFATHNIRSIAHAVAVSRMYGLDKNACEFQILYGMAEPITQALLSMGYRVRTYTPVGKLLPGMAYLVRRLLENTSNESFLKKSFMDNEPFEDLIRPPIVTDNKENKKDLRVLNDLSFPNEPATDFTIKKNTDTMQKAMQSVKKGLGQSYFLYINGNKVIGEGKQIVSVNPANPAEIIGTLSSATTQDVNDAVRGANEARLSWRTNPGKDRADYLFKAAQLMRAQRFEISSLIVLEVGKNWREADADVAEAIDFLEFYGRQAISLDKAEQLGNFPGEINHLRYIPRGVGVVISPWNFPLAIACGMLSAAIAAGNTVIFKPSSSSPVIGAKLVEIFKKVKLPEGVLQFTPGLGSEIGDYLVCNPLIDFIAFTGSMEVGLRIAEKAGKTVKGQRNIKKVILEMGGKNAIIVDESADMDETVKGVGESFLGYQGQKCSACSRVIVVGGVKKEFLKRLKEYVKSMIIGPPEDPKNRLGPVIDKQAQKKIKEYIEIGKKEGKCIHQQEVTRDGYFVGPVIFSEVGPDARIAQEEIFGPVLSVILTDSLDDAIHIANDTPYALTGGLYSRSPESIKKVKQEYMVGNLYINRNITGALVGRQPFGGYGMSGTGTKAGGKDYLYHFLFPRAVSENTIRKGFAAKAG